MIPPSRLHERNRPRRRQEGPPGNGGRAARRRVRRHEVRATGGAARVGARRSRPGPGRPPRRVRRRARRPVRRRCGRRRPGRRVRHGRPRRAVRCRVRDGRGGTAGLGWLIVTHFDTLEADFTRYYQTDLPAAIWGPNPISARRLGVLVRALPPDSALGRELTPHSGWGAVEELLATAIELVDLNNR